MDTNITIRPYKRGDETGILELLKEVFSDNKRWVPEWWEWRHGKNPAGNSIILVVESNGRIIGHDSSLPFDGTYFGQSVKIGMGTELSIKKEFRGHGIYKKIIGKKYFLGTENGWSFFISFPNNNASPGLLKHGSLKVYDYPPMIKILNASRAARIPHGKSALNCSSLIKMFHGFHKCALFPVSSTKQEKGLNISEDNFFETPYDLFWQKVSRSYNIGVNRTSSYLNWRYALNPTYRYDPRYEYRVISVRKGEEIAGFCVLSCTHGETYNTGNIVEFLVLPGFRKTVQILLARINAFFKEKGMDIIVFRLQHFGPLSFAFYRDGFLPAPLRKDLFAVYPLQKNIDAGALREKHNWLLRPGDIGAF